MGGWGPPAGSPMMGPSGAQQAAASGLPFGGIPSEMVGKVEEILADEPEHAEPQVEFRQPMPGGGPFTLRRFLRPHRAGLGLALALVVVETLALQAGPLLTQIGIDDGVLAGSKSTLVVAAALYFVAAILGAAASAWRISFTGRLGERLMEQLRVRVFAHFQRLSLDFYTGEMAGRLMTRMTSDIDSLTALFQDGLVNLAVQGLTLVAITVVLFLLNPFLAVITIGVVVPVMLAMTLWFRGASDRGYSRVRDRIADALADLQESLSGIRIISAHNRRRHNIIAHRNVVGAYRDANNYTVRVGSAYGAASEAVGFLGQAILLAVGGSMVLDGQLTVGELTAFMLYLTQFFAPIQQLVQLYTTYQQGQAAVGKLRELLGTAPSVPEMPDAVELPPLDGEIVLERVQFAYATGQPSRFSAPAPRVLDGIDLRIAPGETFAFVGETGAGKSTIAKLVARFYDPTEGRVLLDGHDVRTVTLASLRRQLGVVPQEPFLFNATLRDNLAFARPDATDEEILDACRAIGIHELIERLPEGLDTWVHERGSSLSSGERQLLALGRAFLARPRVLILDEATSNLDLRSEARIEAALDVILEGRTAIVIAHRMATAMRADRIAVVDAGRIAELGSHDELVALGGIYAGMYATWAGHATT